MRGTPARRAANRPTNPALEEWACDDVRSEGTNLTPKGSQGHEVPRQVHRPLQVGDVNPGDVGSREALSEAWDRVRRCAGHERVVELRWLHPRDKEQRIVARSADIHARDDVENANHVNSLRVRAGRAHG